MRLLSIIIANHNYGNFVGEAVASALAVDWPDIEVIVVDDGSTDNSLAVLSKFSDRIVLIAQPNAGQREACNAAFAVSRGDAVLFLDADDLVESQLAKAVAARWTTTLSKVQVQMLRVDAENSPTGGVTPRFLAVPSALQIRRWVSRTTAYPTPPGSGNIYARSFLAKFFPVDSSVGESADSACLALAPYLGDVETIAVPLVRYRLHGSNDSELLGARTAFAREIDRAVRRYCYAMRFLAQPAPPRRLRRSRELLQFRVADYRIRGGEPALAGDGFAAMLIDAITSLMQPGPESLTRRIGVSLWALAVLTAPPGLARRLVVARYHRR